MYRRQGEFILGRTSENKARDQNSLRTAKSTMMEMEVH